MNELLIIYVEMLQENATYLFNICKKAYKWRNKINNNTM